jgi:hypothetical protein
MKKLRFRRGVAVSDGVGFPRSDYRALALNYCTEYSPQVPVQPRQWKNWCGSPAVRCQECGNLVCTAPELTTAARPRGPPPQELFINSFFSLPWTGPQSVGQPLAISENQGPGHRICRQVHLVRRELAKTSPLFYHLSPCSGNLSGEARKSGSPFAPQYSQRKCG